MAETFLYFDIDNTLYDHEKSFEKAMKDCFTTMFFASQADAERWFPIFKQYCDYYWPDYERRHLTREEYQFLRLAKSLPTFQRTINAPFAKRFQQRYEQIIAKFISPFPGVHGFFEHAYRNKQKIGIITNGASATQRRKLASLALTDWIESEWIIISEEQGVQKPDHAIFNIAAQKANGTESDLLYVGDSWDLDIVPAIDVGWKAVFLNSRNEQRSTEHQPLLECQSFQEVASFLKEYLS